MINIGDFKISRRHRKLINEVLKSKRITEGPMVAKLEREFEKFLGTKNAILVSNGTVALQLVATYLSSFKADINKVLVPAMTFPATINAFLVSGYEAELCDIGQDLQINIDTVDNETKDEIDIIVPVHLMGYPADMPKIMAQAEEHGWIVVEDACEAFGAKIGDKCVGTFGNFGCFSFYASHNVSAGELGLVVTDDDEAAKVIRSMKNHGRIGTNLEFNHKYIGSNYKTTEFTAAMALANMEIVDKILNRRLSNARYMFENINNPNIEQFHCPDGFSPLGYPVECKTETYRQYICEKLYANGIETRHIFPFLGNQEAYEGAWYEQDFPIAAELSKKIFYLPVHDSLTKKDLKKIVNVINGG